MQTWRGHNVFTSGPVSPNIWVVIFPTGTGGMAGSIGPYLIDTLNGRGIFVAGVHWKGCDPGYGEEDYGARYFDIGAWILDMKAEYGLTANPCLYVQSRGGLQGLNFACEAPSMVPRVACLYPVTDPVVYPGRGAALNYAHSEHDVEWDAIMANGQPVIKRYTPNAKAAALNGKPVCIWHGDSDIVVPKTLTTDVFAPLCHAWVKTLSGFGHQAPSQATMDEIVEWLQWSSLPPGAVQQ